MKKLLGLILCALLLCGCAKTPAVQVEGAPVYLSDYTPVDRSQEPEDPEARLQWRRDVAEKEMRRMMSVLWTPAEDITYCYNVGSAGPEADKVMHPKYVVTLYKGRIYQGIPYTHGCGSGDAMISYATGVDEKGVYTLTGLDWAHFSGEAKNTQQKRARLGNNCADSVFWAWASVANSITFKGTTTMTKDYGCIPLGGYKTMPGQYRAHTNTLCQANGEQTMFACYALMQKADGLVYVNGYDTGHAIMCVSTHVERKQDGTIDGEKSYAIILDQTASCEVGQKHYFNETLGQEVYLCEELDKKKSFNELYETGYLPLTIREFTDPAPLADIKVKDSLQNVTADTLLTGEITASHRVAFVTCTITDNTGKTVQKAVCYGKEAEMYRFDLSRFTDSFEQAVMQGKIDVSALDSGEYTACLTAHLSTGDDVTFRTLSFTK